MKLRTSNDKRYRIPIRRNGETAVFIIKTETPEDQTKRVERFTTTERSKGFPKDKFDTHAATLDRVCTVIEEWEGVEDENGNPITCTRENKIAMYLYNRGIIDEVLAEASELNYEAQARIEEEVKNSGSGRKGK